LTPADPAAHLLLGQALSARGNIEAAVPHFREALRLDPASAQAQFQLGLAFYRQGKIPAALEHYRASLRLKADAPDTLNNLAWVLATASQATLRNGRQAVEYAQRACELTRQQQPVLLGTLAAAQAEAGQFEQAVATAQAARDLARARNQPALAERNENLLKEYQAGQPHRETQEP
jgi:Flp pilus assembly protein TadD